MNSEDMETIQTEPQDLSVKRKTIGGDMDDTNALTVDQQMDQNIENNIQTSGNCQTMTDDVNPKVTTDEKEKRALRAQAVRYVTQLYEKNNFWDNVLEQSKSTENLDSIKKLLSKDEAIGAEGQPQRTVRSPTALTNCDTELKHLLIKLKFVNELYDGMTQKVQSEINSYQMKDFQKN